MLDSQLPGKWKTGIASFIAANGTLAKIILDVAPPQVLPAVAVNGPEVALPGEATVRQQILRGGQRVIDGYITSTDAGNKDMQFYIGKQVSLFAAMGAPTVTGTNTINRTIGSFITDGYQIGDTVMGFGYTTAANSGLLLQVTGVTALALTLNGTLLTNETIAATFRLFRIGQWTRRTITANAGAGTVSAPIQLLGGGQDPASLPAENIGKSLGEDDALIAGMQAAVAALTSRIDITAHSVLY